MHKSTFRFYGFEKKLIFLFFSIIIYIFFILLFWAKINRESGGGIPYWLLNPDKILHFRHTKYKLLNYTILNLKIGLYCSIMELIIYRKIGGLTDA